MITVKVLVNILAKIGEHTAVIHMMAVHYQVIGGRNIAVFLHERHSEFAVRLFKVMVQIEIRIVL